MHAAVTVDDCEHFSILQIMKPQGILFRLSHIENISGLDNNEIETFYNLC